MVSISSRGLILMTGCELSLFVAKGFVGVRCVPTRRTSNFGTGPILVANRTAATGMRLFVSMVSASPELLFGGERWLSNVVVFGLAALLTSDAAMFVGLVTPSSIESALLFFGAALSDGSVPPSLTFFQIRGGDLRVFCFSTVMEESRVWGFGLHPPRLRCFRWHCCYCFDVWIRRRSCCG